MPIVGFGNLYMYVVSL